MLCEEFTRRWLCWHPHRMSLIADLRDRYSTLSPSFNGAQVMRALDQVKPSKRIDSMDICALACWVCGIARPDLVATTVTNLLASSSALREVMVIGNVKGKKSPRTLPKDIRAILPLPTLLELGDYLVAKHLNGFIDQLFEPIFGVYVGATRGTQCAEITTSMQLAIEKVWTRSRGLLSLTATLPNIMIPCAPYDWCSGWRGTDMTLSTSVLLLGCLLFLLLH